MKKGHVFGIVVSIVSFCLFCFCGGGGGSSGGDGGVSESISGVTPSSGYFLDDTDITITGSGFPQAPSNALLDHAQEGAQWGLTNVSYVDDKTITATVPGGGYPYDTPYDLVLGFPDGNARLGDAFLITQSPPPEVTSVSPTSGWGGEDTQITITGSDFVSLPQVSLMQGGAVVELENELFIDTRTLRATVQAGLSVGRYTLKVVNPGGLEGTLADAFQVSDQVAPRIEDISPTTMPAADGGALSIDGNNFLPGATVYEGDTEVWKDIEVYISNDPDDLTLHGLTVSLNQSTSQQLAAEVPPDLDIDIYVVTVVNPDGQYDTYSSLKLASSAQGKLGDVGPFTDSGRSLNLARKLHGAGVAVDDLDNSFIYAVGGEDGNTALRNVEFASSSIFGDLGSWRITRPLTTPRSGLGVVSYTASDGTPYIYAIAGGSRQGVNAYATVERARLLTSAAAPFGLSADYISSGSLPAGAWVYRVSAELADGEGLASSAVSVNTSSRGSVELSWSAPSSGEQVNAYYIYRAENGRSGFERRLAQVGSQTTSYTDDGSDTLVQESFDTASLTATASTAPSSLQAGEWCYRVSAVTVNGESGPSDKECATVGGSQVVDLAWTESPDALYYNVYRTETAGGSTVYLVEEKVMGASYTDSGASPVERQGPAQISATGMETSIGALQSGSAYYYAVCAVAEQYVSLPADVSITLGSTQNSVELSWSEVEGALGYNVYRGQSASDLKLIKSDVISTRFIDLGDVRGSEEPGSGLVLTASGMLAPLERGQLGEWQELSGQLESKRWGTAALAVDVSGDTFVYAAGGYDGATYLASVEKAKIRADGSLGSWSPDQAMPTARALHGFAVAHAGNHPDLQGTKAYLYAIQGQNPADVSGVDGAEIGAGGAIGSWDLNISQTLETRYGHYCFVGDGVLYVSGGIKTGTGPTDNIKRGAISADGSIINWPNASAHLTVPRGLHTAVVLNAYMYVIGGQTTTGITGSTEQIPF